MQPRLDTIPAKYDRTAAMGPFPHDQRTTPIRQIRNTLRIAADDTASSVDRDQAIWTEVYKRKPGAARKRDREVGELLHSIATGSKESELRRSASWALFKLARLEELHNCLAKDDDGNTHSWKQHLIYESQGRTDWVDPRPVRAIDSELGYGTTLPLSIHGIVQFRSFNYGSKYGQDDDVHLSSRIPSSYGDQEGASFTWHEMVAGLNTQRRLVGDLTASVAPDTFYDNLVIQKTVTNPLGDGGLHVQGYLFQGMSRSLGGNTMAHYYTSSGPQPLYLSGRIGDRSAGVLDVPTSLNRIAETNIVTNKDVPYPYVQSVRGLFHGPARMNTIISRDSDAPVDNLLQIVKEPYANGYFFGEFRSVPVDVDGDGVVEINGLPMYTDRQGQVLERTPRATDLPFKR